MKSKRNLFKKVAVSTALLGIIGTSVVQLMSPIIVKASTNETQKGYSMLDDIEANMSSEKFSKLKGKYTDEEIISMITNEINDTLGDFSEEITIDLNNTLRLLESNSYKLKTPSGYEFEVTSTIIPDVNSRASTTITGSYDSTFDHQVSVGAFGGVFGTSYLTTKIKVSPGKITPVSTTPTCRGLGVVYCDQVQKSSWTGSYTMPNTYSSFKSYGVYVYTGTVVVGGTYNHNVEVKYGCTAYNGTTRKVTIKVEY